MARNTNMMTDGSGSGRINKTVKKKATATKTIVTPGTKVSKATIDKIKAMGMTKALKSAGSASPEMLEGLKRMYGARRVAAAGGSTSGSKTAKSADEARASASKSSTKVYKSADEARAAYAKSKAPKLGANTVMAAKPSYSQSITKKTSTTSNPFTAAHNKLSPYGNKNQKFVFGSGGKKTVASVKAENARRMGITVAEYDKRFAAAAKKNK